MNYGQFKSLVKDFIPLDTLRSNAETFIDRMIKTASLQLIDFIPSYNLPTETRLVLSDGTAVSNSTLLELDANSDISNLRIAYRYDASVEIEGDTENSAARDSKQVAVQLINWSERHKVINSDDCYVAAYNKVTGQLFLTPALTESTDLVVEVNPGVRGWLDTEVVPFNLKDAECVSHFVAEGIARHIEKNLRTAADEGTLYRNTRRLRYIEETKG